MPPDEEVTYNNSHRAFLQAFIARSTMTYAEAKPILAAVLSAEERRDILANDITEADFHSYITILNGALSPLDYEIRSTFTQTAPRTRIYALVNTTSDAFTQMATTHSADELAYLKRVLDEMFDVNNRRKEIMAIKSMQAVRLHKGARNRTSTAGIPSDGNDAVTAAVSSSGNFTMAQAEKMLKSLVAEGWFEKREGWFTLTPRALMELRGWLLETYNEPDEGDGESGVERIKLCLACRDIVTVGQRCATSTCACRLHDHCTQSFFRVQRSTACPLCKAEWTGRDFVGVRAAESAGASASGNGIRNGNGNGNGLQGSTARRAEPVDLDEDDEEDEDGDAQD